MVEPVLREAMDDARVVVVNGPRQSGKSTLLDLVAADRGQRRQSLDDVDLLRAARTDPAGFVSERSTPLFIDEVQRGGDRLVLSIKAEVDRRHTETGLYVLAGSSRFLTVPQLSESLAGRVRIIDLWPLSQSEIDRIQSGFIAAVFGGAHRLREMAPQLLTRREVMERVARGGFPASVRMVSERARAAWFGDYARTLLERDITELSRIRLSSDLPRLLRLIAARTSQELNLADLARDADLTADSVRTFLALFETIYLHFPVRAWSANLTSRSVKRPKLHMVDSGLGVDLRGISATSLAEPNSPDAGPVLESFVVSEVARLASASGLRLGLYHYRDREKREVDLLLETRDGNIVAIEVKATKSVTEDDFKHLRYLRDRVGDRFIVGIVMHLGAQPLSFGDRLVALPVSALWAA